MGAAASTHKSFSTHVAKLIESTTQCSASDLLDTSVHLLDTSLHRLRSSLTPRKVEKELVVHKPTNDTRRELFLAARDNQVHLLPACG